MESINRHNYEIYFIDYLDGKLNDSQVDVLFTFLRENPDLREELESISEVQLQPDKGLQFQQKSKLKKNPHILPGATNNLDELCIAKMEGDLSLKESQEFDNLMKENEELYSSYVLYKKTKLVPDVSLTYPQKEKLKKERKVIPLFTNALQKTLAYAAGVILLVAVYINMSSDYSNNNYNKLSNKILKSETSIPTEVFHNTNFVSDELLEETYISNLEYNNLSFEPKVEVSVFAQQPGFDKLSPLSKALTLKPEKVQYASVEQELKIPDSYISQGDKPELKTPVTRQALAIFQENTGRREKGGISLLDVADLGFQGIKKLTGKDWEIKRFYNDEGELTKLALKAESVSFSTNINK